jgi:carboxyl-terminal processing protease
VSPGLRALIFPLLILLLLLSAGLNYQNFFPQAPLTAANQHQPLTSTASPAAAAEQEVETQAIEPLTAVGYSFDVPLEAAAEQINPTAVSTVGALPEALGSEETAQVAAEAARTAAEPLAGSSGEEISAEVKKLQQSIFNELWAVVYENYLYPDYNGVNWQTVRREQHDRIENGMSMPAFYQTLSELISGLGDDHSRFLDPERRAAEDDKYSGNQGFVGVGVFLLPVPERDRAALLAVAPDSPAYRAGLQPHDSILSVDGEPILDEHGRLKSLLRGPEDSQVSVIAQSPGQEPRSLTLTRQRIAGPLPLPYTVVTTPTNQRLGYFLLLSFADSTIPVQLEQALLSMNADAPLDGLVLDNRFNEGGADTVLRSVLVFFTHGRLGNFVGRRTEKPLEVVGIKFPVLNISPWLC